MGDCKDCVFWGNRADDWGKRWNECGKVGSADRTFKPKDNEFFIFAEAHDDSGLWDGLVTGPMFGCVQFEKKEATHAPL